MDQYYYEEGFIVQGYYAYIAEARVGFTPYIAEGYLPNDFFEDRGAFAAIFCDAEIVVGMLLEAQAYLSGTFSTTTSVQRFLTTSIALTSSFTQTAIGTRGKDTDLFAFSDAAISVQVSRIRSTNITASSVFSVAVDFVVKRNADADVDAIFSAIINGLRSRDTNLETQAAFSFDVAVNVIKGIDSTITAEFASSIVAERLRGINSSQNSEFTQATAGDRIRFGTSAITATSTVTATVRKIRDAHLTGTGVAAIACDAVKTTSAQIALTSVFSQQTAGGFTFEYSATLTSHASIFVSRNAYNRTRIELEYIPIQQTYAKFGTSSAQLNSSSVLKTLNYPNQIRAYIGDQFVVQGWYRHNSGMDGGPLMYCGAGTGITDTSVGDNQWAVRFTARNVNNQTLIKYQLLTRNSSNQTVRFDSAEFQLSAYLGAPWTQAPAPNPTTNNQWNHFAVTKDASNLISFKINGTTVVSGTISSLGTASQYRIGFARFNSFDFIYWDEISYRKDTDAVDLGALTNDVDKQVFLFHLEEYETQIPIDDNSLPIINHSGNANLTSSSTLTSIIGVKRLASAALSAQTSVTAVIGTLETINLVAFSDAAVNATITKIKALASDIASDTSVSTIAVKTASIDSSLTSASTFTASAKRTRDVSANIVSQGSILTAITNLEGTAVNLVSSFTTLNVYLESGYLESGYYTQFETNVNVIASGSASLSVVATLTAGARTDVFAALVTTSQASITATVVKTVSANIAQSGAFATSIVGRRIAGGVAAPTAVFTVFCNAVTAGEINMVAFTNASVSATGTTTKPGNAVLNSQATFFAYTQDSLNSVGEADISSEFSTNIGAVKRVSAVIVTEAVASSLSVVVKAVAVQIPLDCNFTQTATAFRIKQISSSQSALATVSTTAVKTATAQSTITAQSTVVASATKVVSAVIVTQAVASTLTANVRIAGLFIDCAVTSTVSVSGIATKRAVATIASTATVTIATVKLVSASAAITSTNSLSATVGVRKPFTATFTSALTFVVAIRDLRLDEIVYVIPGENYVYTITSESRIHEIYGETRIRSVTGESRIRTITGESRIHIN